MGLNGDVVNRYLFNVYPFRHGIEGVKGYLECICSGLFLVNRTILSS